MKAIFTITAISFFICQLGVQQKSTLKSIDWGIESTKSMKMSGVLIPFQNKNKETRLFTYTLLP